MGTAQEAFEEAKRRIAEAARTGAKDLDLSIEGLERIPEEITGLTQTTRLFLGNTQISDLAPIAGLTGITGLFLSKTRVSDLRPIKELTGITRLDLRDTLVTNLEPISGMTGIIRLAISDTQVSDLGPIAQMRALIGLDLSNTPTKDLTPIAGITGIVRLHLRNTQVRDLSAISGITGLATLDLRNTRVSDLRPIAEMHGLRHLDIRETSIGAASLQHLAGKPGLVPQEDSELSRGIHFAGSLAAREDAQLSKIAEITNARKRTVALFDYLGFDAQGEPMAPGPDPLFGVRIEGGRLEVAAAHPSAAEADERLKRLMHDRLREKAAACAQKAGNRFPRLSAKARTLRELVDRQFEELDLVSIHVEVEDIEAQAKVGAENDLPYDAELLAAVGEITRAGPGLTRDNAEVELYVDRYNRTRETVPVAATEEARAALSEAILAAPEAHGDVSIRMEVQARDATDPVVPRVIREPKHRNMLWKLATVAVGVTGTMVTGVASSLVATAYGPAITAFVQSNWALLVEVAATYGAAFASWFTGAVGVLMIGRGVRQEIERRRSDGDAEGG